MFLGFGPVKLGTTPEHLFQATGLWAVWVFGGFAFGVVLAVNGRPSLGLHTGAEPQPETEHMRHHGVQVERAVRLVSVQVNGDCGDGGVGGQHGKSKYRPTRPVQ